MATATFAYRVDSTEVDQGATGSGQSLKALVDSIIAENATIYFTHHGSASTTFTLTTSETVPANITLVFQNGALLDGAGTITFDNPSQIVAAPNQQVFGSSLTVVFTQGGKGYAEWWGIDGTADEVQINKSLAASGHTVLLENKTYVVAASITPGDDDIIEGHGWTTIIQASTTINNGVISQDDTTNGNSRITVRDLKIDGNGQTTPGIYFQGGTANTDAYIERVWVDDVRDYGILIGRAKRCQILNNKVTQYGAILANGQGNGTEDGIRISYGEDCEINGNYIDNSDLIGTQHGNNLTYGRHAITLGTNTTTTNIVSNNIIITTERHGINAEGSSEKTIITGNKVYDAGTYGIVSTSDYGVVSNNYVEGAGQNGIRLGGDNYGLVICSGNTVLSCGADPLTANSGNDLYESSIIAQTPTMDYQITNNTVRDSTGSGIYLEEVGGICSFNTVIDGAYVGIRIAESGWTVIGNRIDGNADDGISVANSVTNLILTENVSINNTGYGADIGTSVTGKMLGNRFYNNTAGNIDLESIIEGEQVVVLIGDVAAGTDIEYPVFYAPGFNGTVISDVVVINGANITAHAVNYFTLQIYDKGSDGNASNGALNVDTNTAGDNVSFTDFNAVSMRTSGGYSSGNTLLGTDDVLSFATINAGGGQVLTDAVIIIKYITF